MTKELLQQALVNVHDAILRGNSDGELLVMIDDALRDAKAQQEQPSQEPVAWYLSEDSNILGVEWSRQKPKYGRDWTPLYKTAPTQPAQEQPAQKPDLWKTQFLTDVMTSAGLLMYGRTDKKLAQRIADGSARWRTELYTHPEQPVQKVSESWTDIVAVNLVREGVNKHKARELAAHFLTLFAPPTPPAQEPFKWYDGAPPFPQNQESFIAQTIYGERVVLRVLPEEYTYDYTTADGTYMKAENIEKWMQFPDCEFLPPEPAPTQPALKDDVGVACLETMVKTMTNLGIATDSSLEGFGARLETHIYAMCRAVDGIFKARPALSDMECRYLVEQALTDYANLTWTPRRHLDTDLNSNPALVVIIAKAIEAHCRGGAAS